MNNETTTRANTIDGPPEMASDVRPPKNFGRIDPSLPFNDQDFATDSAGAIRRAILHVLVEDGFRTLDEIFDGVERFAKESNDSNGLKIDDIESVDLFQGDVDYLANFFGLDVDFYHLRGDAIDRDPVRAVNSFEAALEDLDRAGRSSLVEITRSRRLRGRRSASVMRSRSTTLGSGRKSSSTLSA